MRHTSALKRRRGTGHRKSHGVSERSNFRRNAKTWPGSNRPASVTGYYKHFGGRKKKK